MRTVDEQNERGDGDEQEGKKVDRSKTKRSGKPADESRPARSPSLEPAKEIAGLNQRLKFHSTVSSAGARGVTGGLMRSRRTRRGSASRISNSEPDGSVTISPRWGTRPKT